MPVLLPDPMNLPARRRCPLDPPDEYAQLREERPISRLRLPGGRVGWLVTRYEDVRTILADPRLTPPLIQVTPNADLPLPEEELQVPPGMFSAMDPPEQSRYRRLVSRHFTRKRMREIAPRIERIVDEQLSGMISAGPTADLVQWFSQPIPTRVITEMLGIPASDQADYQRWIITTLTLGTSPEEIREVGVGLYGSLNELLKAKLKEPGDDIISELLHGEKALSHEEVLAISILLLIAGLETTANMLGLGAFALLQHPDQADALRADPDRLDVAIEELLRHLTIVQFGLTRTAREDLVLAGTQIKAGETLVASLSASANRDGEFYTDPDRLDVFREETPHLAFGHGVHQCLGAQLARVEMKIAFGALLRRLPTLRLAVPVDQVPTGEDKVFYGVHSLPVTWDK